MNRLSSRFPFFLNLIYSGFKKRSRQDFCSRPPGLTNEEFAELRETIRSYLNKYSKKYFHGSLFKDIRRLTFAKMSMDFSHICSDIELLLNEYFLRIPQKTKSFIDEKHIFRIYPELSREEINVNKIACQICGENRGVDIAHIVPSRILNYMPNKLSNKLTKDNFLYLCPNHHRFFDQAKLFKIEWGRINLGDKHEMVVDFFNIILFERQKRFWDGQTPRSDLLDELWGKDFDLHPIHNWAKKYALNIREMFNLKSDHKEEIYR